MKPTRWQEIGDRVFRRRYDYLQFNAGVVLGDEDLLLIESRASHPQAQVLWDDLRMLSSLPIHAVVNTHWHWDHCWGNATFRSRPLWGHIRCREVMIERGRAMIESVLSRVPAEMRQEIEAVEIVPPENVFADSATIWLGDRAVDLRFFGLAHTDSDIVIIVPDAAVSFAGDLIEEWAPPAFRDSYPVNWPITLARALEYMQGVVVPGHGDVVDLDFVSRQLAELEFIANLARRVHNQDMALDEALTLGPYPAAYMRTALERGLAQLGGTLA